MMISDRRLTASEREALVRLCVAQEILDETLKDQTFATRMGLIPYAKRDLAMMAKKIDNILAQAASTIPREQLSTYNNSLLMASYCIGVKGPAGNGKRDDQFGMWPPYDVLNALLEGCHDHCLMCDLDKYGCKRCALRKALEIVPNDVPDDETLGCKYRMAM